MEIKISDVLEEKGRDVISVGLKATVFDAIKIMAEHKIGAILVLEGEKPVGIFSERDYMNKIILQGHSSKKTPVKDVMTRDVACVTSDAPLNEGLAIMNQVPCRHLPVLKDKKLAGVVSIGDLVRKMLKHQEATIHYLNEYIQLAY
ncbi:MAG: CBS domain-containing protein [Candidatus Aminicenantes bacterium]|nr:CBS domain-containing protein [Candidatus Aminicenantes bacterium]